MTIDFDAWADIYRVWTDLAAPDEAEIAFYRRLAESANGPVADLGIGLGRMAAQVRPDIGIDISGQMLAESRRRLGAGIKLVQADLASCILGRPVALQYSAQNTLNHIPAGRLPAVFRAASRNSRPNGRLAFEAALAQPGRNRARERVPVLRALDATHAVYDITLLHDQQGRSAELVGMLEHLDQRGRVVERRYFPPIPFAFLTVPDITAWATLAGWEVESMHTDFHGTPINADSASAVCCLRRP